MKTQDCILGRRSVSSFTDDPVPMELVDDIISIAAYAPSSCNTQPWFFLVFSTIEAQWKLQSYIRRGYERKSQSLKEKHSILGGAYGKLLNFFSQYGKFDAAPVLILLFAKPYDTPIFSHAIKLSGDELIEKIARESVVTSSAMAMQNLLLIAHDRWLGTRVKDGVKFFMGFDDLKHDFCREFDIPESYELISGIQLGYPTKEAITRNTPERRSLSDIRRSV